MSELKSQKSTKSSKGFQITFNEIEKFDDVLAYLRGLKPNYLIAAKEEAPTTGHKHIHCYIQFPNARRLSLKKLEGAHVEKCYGSPQQNKDYVEKEGQVIIEEGQMKTKGGKTIKDVEKMSKEERSDLPIQLYNIVNKVNQEEAKNISVDDYHKDVEVYYYWGESGAGKTRAALKLLKEKGFDTFNEIKCINGFWHGVSETPGAALYDDFRYSHMPTSEFINFIDYNRHSFNVKGGSIRNNYKLIIITSVQDPEELYPALTEKDQEPKKQWLRRMKNTTKFEILNN